MPTPLHQREPLAAQVVEDIHPVAAQQVVGVQHQVIRQQVGVVRLVGLEMLEQSVGAAILHQRQPARLQRGQAHLLGDVGADIHPLMLGHPAQRPGKVQRFDRHAVRIDLDQVEGRVGVIQVVIHAGQVQHPL